MADKWIQADASDIKGFAYSLGYAPKKLAQNLARGFADIGKYDIEKLKESLPGTFNIKSKGLANSFKSKAKRGNDVRSVDDLSVTEYTGWKAAEIFQTGGTVTGHGKQLTIITDAGRLASGRRKYTQQQVRDMLASGQAELVPTKNAVLIVLKQAKTTKKGSLRKGSKYTVIGLLVHAIQQKKRLNFFENAEKNGAVHQQFLEERVEQTLKEIAEDKSK